MNAPSSSSTTASTDFVLKPDSFSTAFVTAIQHTFNRPHFNLSVVECKIPGVNTKLDTSRPQELCIFPSPPTWHKHFTDMSDRTLPKYLTDLSLIIHGVPSKVTVLRFPFVVRHHKKEKEDRWKPFTHPVVLMRLQEYDTLRQWLGSESGALRPRGTRLYEDDKFVEITHLMIKQFPLFDVLSFVQLLHQTSIPGIKVISFQQIFEFVEETVLNHRDSNCQGYEWIVTNVHEVPSKYYLRFAAEKVVPDKELTMRYQRNNHDNEEHNDLKRK
eukprot:PhF_6_TR37218/c0_g1_i2/m.54885